MSSSPFKSFEFRTGARRSSEELFRAAISAFCALTRPSRREVAQLDDLALPLLGGVSREGRRFAAAALSECEYAPPMLIRRLAGDVPEVAAPLLIRCTLLRDVDLISVIANCGLTHARAIARRTVLSKPVRDLLRSLKDAEIDRLRDLLENADGTPVNVPQRGQIAREARDKLKAMMQPGADRDVFADLLNLAWDSRPALFQTRLADRMGLDFEAARRICESDNTTALLATFRILELPTSQVYMLVSILHPTRFTDAASVRVFTEHYEALSKDEAGAIVRELKVETASEMQTASLRAAS